MNWNIWKNRPLERWALRLVLIFLVGVILLGAADFAIFHRYMEPRGGDLRPQVQVTIYERTGGVREDTTLAPLLQRGDRAVVRVPLPRELSRPQAVLAFTAEHVCLRTSWHGRVLDRYGMGDVEPYKLFGKVTRLVPIPEQAWGEDVIIEMTAMQDQAHVFITPVYLMDASKSWQYPLEENLLFFLLFLSCLVLLVAALVLLIAWWHVELVQRGIALAIFCISFIIWMMGYQCMMPLLSADPYQNACIEYGALFFMAIPFLSYLILAETNGRRRRVYGLLRLWFSTLFIFAAIFQTTSACSMKDLLPILHVTLFGTVALIVWHRFHPLEKEDAWNILFRYGFLATFASVVLGMLQYYFFNYLSISAPAFLANKFIASGLVIFLLTLIFCYVYRFVGQVMQLQENRIYKRMALQDMLTGLLSRAGIFEAVRDLRPIDRYAVLFFDVNGLKEANDLYGHATGDRLLRLTGAILEDTFQPEGSRNLCARVGGDEFLVVVRVEDLSRIEALCTSVRQQLESLAGRDGFPEDVSISCGISENDPTRPKAFEEHIKIADDRMYAAKNAYKRKKYGGRRASDRVFLREERKDDPQK